MCYFLHKVYKKDDLLSCVYIDAKTIKLADLESKFRRENSGIRRFKELISYRNSGFWVLNIGR